MSIPKIHYKLRVENTSFRNIHKVSLKYIQAKQPQQLWHALPTQYCLCLFLCLSDHFLSAPIYHFACVAKKHMYFKRMMDLPEPMHPVQMRPWILGP